MLELIMNIKSLIVLPVVMVLAACTSTIKPEVDYRQDYAFENIRTYSVLEDTAKPMDAVYHVSDIENDRVARALQNAMANKGLREVPKDQADILVAYQIVTKDKTQVRDYGPSVAYRCYRCFGGYAGVNNTVDVRNYTEGTIIIDMLDPKSNESVWRSMVSKPLKKHKTVEEKDQATFDGVTKMLENFLVTPVGQ